MQLGRLLKIWLPDAWRYYRRTQRQRNRPRRMGRIAATLAVATCALLGAADNLPVHAGVTAKNWKFDSALLYYDEGDQVSDASLNFVAQRSYGFGRSLAIRFGFDTLTGASASGAVASTAAQTFTTPSGNNSYQTTAGKTPLDPTFFDTRFSLSANWAQPAGRKGTIDAGLSFSAEFDYLHIGANTRYERDFNERNTTLTAGIAVAADSLDPSGGIPIALDAMLPEGQFGNKLGTDSKTVVDLLLGVTQVLGKRTIGQLNYSFSTSSGYLTDPYKILSVIDPVTGDPVPGPGGIFLYRFEGRPDSRAKHSLFAQIKRRMGSDILNASYRFMTDDWGIDSHTIDLQYRWRLKRFYLQPHLRYYTQGAADFYRAVLLDGDPVPQYASADYRLGELDGITYGVKVGMPTARDTEWSLRLEFYDQSLQTPAETQVGSLQNLWDDPSVDSLIFQLGYRF